MALKMTIALVATILIEYGVLLLLGERRRRVLWSSVVVNILTNIPLNLFLRHIDGGWTALLVGELLVVAVETLWYYCFVKRLSQAFTYSVLCNAISFLVGLLFQFVFLYFGIIII